MLLSDDKQFIDELVRLYSFERDIKLRKGGSSNENTEALVLKSAKSEHQSQKSNHRSVPNGECHYCHKSGHWVKNCSELIAVGKPKKNSVNVKAVRTKVQVILSWLCRQKA